MFLLLAVEHGPQRQKPPPHGWGVAALWCSLYPSWDMWGSACKHFPLVLRSFKWAQGGQSREM